MSLVGLVLPAGEEPVAARHPSWDTAAISATVGSHHLLGVTLDWRISPDFELMLFAAGDGNRPYNKAALALGGAQAQHLRGDVLLLGIHHQQVIGLGPADLLIIATRLIVAEAAAGELT